MKFIEVETSVKSQIKFAPNRNRKESMAMPVQSLNHYTTITDSRQ